MFAYIFRVLSRSRPVNTTEEKPRLFICYSYIKEAFLYYCCCRHLRAVKRTAHSLTVIPSPWVTTRTLMASHRCTRVIAAVPRGMLFPLLPYSLSMTGRYHWAQTVHTYSQWLASRTSVNRQESANTGNQYSV